ncbi:MAG TPA: lipid-A-disaccharide synthase [Candidatus Acidoferrales bacterium]|jgi:lipid-A-disaccharide synthase|nr:lipid-A-disaccharide synthase [Candidatus Acidoferrales bacterium]
MKSDQILISAGEASGDLYAGHLAAELSNRTDAHLFGMGGERMLQAGVELVARSSDVALTGFSEVWSKLPVLRRTLNRLAEEAERRKPRIAILTDFPSFHLRLASRLNRLRIPCVYFVAPQFWAWRPWRANLIRRRFVSALCIFPFEEEFFRKAGIDTTFIGHPLVDIVRPSMPRAEFLASVGLDSARPIVALLPGSRWNELHHNLPAVLEACARIARQEPGTQFILALAGGFSSDAPQAAPPATNALRIQSGVTHHTFALPAGLNLRVAPGTAYDALAAATVAIVASGTATVETALLGTPMVVVYRVGRLTELMIRTFARTSHVAMPNLIAGRAIVPELLQQDCTPERISAGVLQLMNSRDAREEMQRGLSEVRERLGAGGAIGRAADLIARML